MVTAPEKTALLGAAMTIEAAKDDRRHYVNLMPEDSYLLTGRLLLRPHGHSAVNIIMGKHADWPGMGYWGVMGVPYLTRAQAAFAAFGWK